MNVTVGKLHDEGGAGHDGDQQHPGERRRISGPVFLEGAGVQVVDVKPGGIIGAALRHHERLREHLERIDDPHDELEQQHGGDHRQRNVREDAQTSRSVELGGFDQAGRHALQARQEQNHSRAGRPQRHDDERVQRGARVHQPGRAGNAEPGQHVIEQADLRIENPVPKQRHRHPGDHARKIHRRPEEPPQRQLLMQQQRKSERQQQLDRHADEGVAERDRHGLPEQIVVEHLDVVGETDEFGRVDNVVVGEAVVQRCQDRIQGKNHEADKPGRDEQIHVERLPPAFTMNHGTTSLSRIKLKRFNFC